MMPGIFHNTAIPVLEEVVTFSEKRHELLASNLANMDTPGYKTRDLSQDAFHEALKGAIKARDRNRQPLDDDVPGSAPSHEMQKVKDSLKHILYHDGSDVSLEHQVAELSKNQYMHNMAISIMMSQFRTLETAISERV